MKKQLGMKKELNRPLSLDTAAIIRHETRTPPGDTTTVDLSDKVALVWDSGLFTDFACRLARDFKKVYYYTTWQTEFPMMNQGRLGEGMPGLERVLDPLGPCLDEADIVCFTDLYFGQTQERLVSMGKRVWGGRTGENIELYRTQAKEMMKSVGLPVGPYEVVDGMKALRLYLKEHKDVYVKTDLWRGTFESFHCDTYANIEPKLDEIAGTLGPFAEHTTFIVEDALPDCIEAGIDTFTVDGENPPECLSGIEIKDAAYKGVFRKWSDFPEPLTRVNEAIAPILKQYQYRGPISTEVRIGKDHEPYVIDWTCRLPSPPSEIYQEMYENVSQHVWFAADGIMVPLEASHKYGSEIILKSHWAVNHVQPLTIPEEYQRLVKLHNPVFLDGKYYVMPQGLDMPEIGAAIGLGNTQAEADDMAIEVAGSVEGYGVCFDKNVLLTADDEIEKMQEYGLEMF